MPISAERMKLYPGGSIRSKEWRSIVADVGERSGWRCEGGSPRYPECEAAHGEPHPVTGSKVVLTVAHLDHDELETRDIARLRHWCQRCHNAYDAPKRAINRRKTLEASPPKLSDKPRRPSRPSKPWTEEKRERHRAYQKAWRIAKAGTERFRAQKKKSRLAWAAKNPDKNLAIHRASAQRSRLRDIEKDRLQRRQRVLRRKARMAADAPSPSCGAQAAKRWPERSGKGKKVEPK